MYLQELRFFGITKYASEFFQPTNNIGVSEELTVKANFNKSAMLSR